ncbi:MAG: hypothetical protein K2W85_14235 [Phycisphaerales bacterium]|nr:hypothetical protein [Phycisphaerales bacterium]
MGISDRRYDTPDQGEGGGFRRALRRVFVEGDNFFNWALTLFWVPRAVPWIGGIQVQIHIFYIIFILAKLIWPIRRDAVGFMFEAFSMLSLFTLVLLHEFGHCVACRKVGGSADRVLMWPLGGLAMCSPPHTVRANFITVAGGPAVNLALIPVFGGVLLALGAGWGAVIFNPFDRGAVILNNPFFTQNTSYWRYFLWSAHEMNLYLFLFNMLLVMFPMDGGRMLQCALWARLGYYKGTLIAVNVGLFLAVIIGVFSLILDPKAILFGICVFCGITCFTERQRLIFQDGANEPWAYDTDKGFRGFGPETSGAKKSGEDKAFAAAAKRQEKERAAQAEVDRILDKIREQGMQSLTRRERAILKDETERKRGVG